ncbi:MAG: hypothetical protein RI897_1650 [Verrucomicrobiota bacterium]|jgi:hypothetical protein
MLLAMVCGHRPRISVKIVMRKIYRPFCLLSLLALLVLCCGIRVEAGSILREVWTGIGGTSVSDLTSNPSYPNNPSSTNLVTDYFESPTDVLENYGQRMHGYVVPPQSGNYTFWIASDDGGELWLSTDEDPANARVIATVQGWTSSREWTREINQQSAAMNLVAGQFYYISALMKEGGGGDNLAVKWRRPDGVEEGPIPATYLEPWGLALEPPQISEQPVPTSAVEGGAAEFSVRLAKVTPANYQWRKNGVNIPGATTRVLSYGPVSMADQGALFSVVVSNDLGSETSAGAALTVLADQVKPTLVGALSLGPTSVGVTFSEPVSSGTANVSANYKLNNGASVLSATLASDGVTVVLTTSALSFGTTYTLTVNNVTDRAQVPNPILPNSQTTFIAIEYSPADVGGPVLSGGIERVGDGAFDVRGGGSDIGGTSDQMHFAWEYRVGDFDVRARVAGMSITDPFVKAGLVVRDSLNANARYAGIFLSSPQVGGFFSSRTVVGGSATTGVPVEGFPVNVPEGWVRLRRVGTQLIGFASLDGVSWMQLGSVSISGLPSQLMFGMAVSSADTGRVATAAFRDLGATTGAQVLTTPWTYGREPLGPSSRRTGLVFSEIMYHPSARVDARNLEFVELYNARNVFEDLSGWRISGEIDYVFPEGFVLEAGDHVVVAAVPADVSAVYGITNVLGPYAGALANGGGKVRLRNASDAIRLEVDYGDSPRWPAAADGAGHSLILARPSYGEGDVRAWDSSQLIGGSPGGVDAVRPDPLMAVVINEYLAHTDLPQVDYIELYNTGSAEVDLSGCVVTDDPSTNRYVIPSGTTLGAGTHLLLEEGTLGFRLSAAGETLYFVKAGGSRVIDAVKYGAQENGVASGRVPDGAPVFRRLAAPTPGGANAARRVEDVVINEIMYHPISNDDDDEYVELHNRGAGVVDLSGWRLERGISFEFPQGASLAPGGYLVVGRSQARLLANYPGVLSAANTFGDYSGSLADGGEGLALRMPDTVTDTNELGVIRTNRIFITVGEVDYRDGGRWGQYADGGGSSLELVDSRADPAWPSNWADSDERSKGSWTQVEVTGVLDNGNGGYAPDRLHIGMLGAGECMVDEVEVIPSGSSTSRLANGGFESGTTSWTFSGNHKTSTVDSSGAFAGTRCLHLLTEGDGDTAPNTVRGILSPALSVGQTATIRARVKWLAGWPEVLFRLRGNHLELPARMAVPKNLGTPGAVNSRRASNVGPAIVEVKHQPVLPRASEAVKVTARVSDVDDVASVLLRYRVDPSTTVTSLTMRDDGLGGDEHAGDGVFTATLSGRSAGSLVAFRVAATDDASVGVASTFPVEATGQECLVRWGDPTPFGSFAHYHVWLTSATMSAWGASGGLDNTWRDATVAYGPHRVIYNTRVRDKGSPWHGGYGDLAGEMPSDDRLLGASDRVWASTGNGGSEGTGIRSQVASWVGQQLGIPYLHAQYVHVFQNGSPFGGRNIMEDLEQPNHDHGEAWFPDGGEGDLYKVAMWFEFGDDNSSFGATSATAERFTTTGGAYKLARYRWHFQRRSNDGNASNFTNLFDMVTALNSTANYVPGVLNQIDAEQWIRSYAYSFVMGNWDVWSYNVGQNMYAYKQPGDRWKLMPWDIDFVLGLGDGTSGKIWGGQDPVINRMYDTPEFRRMVWRAVEDTINVPYQPENYEPQIEARSSVLARNAIGGLQDPSGIRSYIEGRRAYLEGQLAANNTSTFAITTNGGADYTTSTPTVLLTGQAPFGVATIEVNGVPYTATWSTFTTWRISVPMTDAVNVLNIVGRDLRGQVVAGAQDTITIQYTGTVQRPEDYVVINEVNYNPLEPSASYLELYNASTSTAFDLSGWRLEGAAYTFPTGAVMGAGTYLVLVKDRAAFGAAYGNAVLPFDEFPGQLDNGGETLRLVKPGLTSDLDITVSDVRYDDVLPWSSLADGQGPSLQLIDPSKGSWRVGNWGVKPVADANRVTPGVQNSTRQTLAAFPDIWINEVMPSNQTGATDAAGEREPWIEIVNTGVIAVDMSAYYLTDSYTNLTKWAFPSGSSIPAGGFLLVWADGEVGEGSAAAPHTSFRLNSTNGSVALVRMQGTPSTAAVMDYVDYVILSADRSFGAIPDGEPRLRRFLHYPTPGAANDPSSPEVAVRLNEYMALNTSTVQDPADGAYEDWFELYNGGPEDVDLTAFTLTDNVTNSGQFVIPPGYVVPAGGFLLVWADNEPSQNSPTNAGLHVNFALSGAGEQLGLFAPDGTLVDSLTFGQQLADVSEGVYPDGSLPPVLALDIPTPGTANLMAGGNLPPVVVAPDQVSVAEMVQMVLDVDATDPDAGQTLTFSLGAGAPAGMVIDATTGVVTWTPAEDQGPGVYNITVIASDDGVPVRSGVKVVQVTVTEVNRAPVLTPPGDKVANEGSVLAINMIAVDVDIPANGLVYSLDAGAPAGAVIDPVTGAFTWTPAESQGPGVYPITVRVTDDGVPSLSAAQTFSVTVNEVNNPPVMPVIGSQTVEELSEFRLQVAATDPDNPPSAILYSLDAAPAGAVIDASSGWLTWTPTEAQGPTNAIFIVRATEVAVPNPSSSRTFSVAVTEKNQAPTLQALSNQTVVAGETLSFTAVGSDADLPRQVLTYSLDAGAPAGAFIDPVTGVFAWTPDYDAPASTNQITVRVTDDGPGLLSAARTLQVVVEGRFLTVINEVMHTPSVAGASYVELHNPSSQASADLSGFVLESATMSYTFAGGTVLVPGGHISVSGNLTAFTSAYGAGLNVVGPWTGSLANDGTLRLVRPGSGEVVDEVTYHNALPWPSQANGGGASLQLKDPLQDNNRLGNWSATVNFGGDQTVVELTSNWSYFQDGAPPAGWSGLTFDDAPWSSGPGLLYVETTDIGLPRQTPLVLGQSAYYFRTAFDLAVVPNGATLELSYALDDGAVFWLNGQELTRVRMPEGDITHDTYAAGTVGDAALEGPDVFGSALLRAGRNVLAVEVHQTGPGSSDIVMGAELRLVGGEVAAYTPSAPNNVSEALGRFPTLRINEVLMSNVTGVTDSAGDREPWIEIVNTGATAVSLDGLYLSNDPNNPGRWAFPAGWSILPGGYLVVFADGEEVETVGSEFHTNFRLLPGLGGTWNVQLSMDVGSGFVGVDAMAGRTPVADVSVGLVPDGYPAGLVSMQVASPGGSNAGVSEPVFEGIGLDGNGSPVISWFGEAGVEYVLEATEVMPAGIWEAVSTVTGAGSVVTVTDEGAGGMGQRYYRVVVLQP